MRKYDLYMVKVVVDGVETVVKTNRDATSYSEMKDLYSKTKEKVTSGNVMFVGINSTGYTTIHSKNIEKKEEIDEVVSSLIENINWILDFSEKSEELLRTMDMSKDMYLKNVELFNDYEIDDEEETRKTKEKIFDELKEILVLRRKTKYNAILANKISSRLNLEKILKDIDCSVKSLSKNTSVNISTSDIEKQNEYSIRDFFNLDNIQKISEIRKENDKVLVTSSKIVGYNKTRGKKNKDVKSNDFDKSKVENYSDVLGDTIYKCPKFDFENPNVKCDNKKLFQGIQDIHLDSFIKNKSKDFNLITKKGSNFYCYKFENPKELMYFDKNKFEKSIVKTTMDVFGEIIHKSSEFNFDNSNIVCIDKKLFKNVSNLHIDNFIKNKSKNYNIISRKGSFAYCYKFEEIKEKKLEALVS